MWTRKKSTTLSVKHGGSSLRGWAYKAANETGSSVFIDDVYRVIHPAQIQPNAAMQS